MTAPWIAAFFALWALVLVEGMALLGLLRRVTSVLERTEAAVLAPTEVGGAAPGTKIPPFEVQGRSGERVHSKVLLSSPAVVLFVGAGCAPCHQLVLQLEGVAEFGDGARLIVISDDSPERPTLPTPPGPVRVFQRDRAASDAFQNAATPQAFAVDGDAVVRDTLVPGSLQDLRRLAGQFAEGGDISFTRPSAAA